jgi:hypothetical protein
VGDLKRHILACNNADLPGRHLAFRIGAALVGWVLPDLAEALARFPEIERAPDGLTLHDPPALDGIAAEVARQGFGRRRGEAFDVRADTDLDGPVLATVDRGALPAFGIAATGVHVNGLVRDADGIRLWVGRRAASKALDPSKLDHIVAGGIAAGMTAKETLVKEGEEEAAIPAGLSASAVEVARICYALERFEGLRRDRLICYDLWLPASFQPKPTDGEVERFDLWPLDRVLATVRDTDQFKFNVNLVLIDLFLRLDLVAEREATELRTSLYGASLGPK